MGETYGGAGTRNLVPWLTVGIGLFIQMLIFSWQYGGLSTRVTENDRRLADMESHGPANMGPLKTQIEVNDHRLDAIERNVPDRVNNLAITVATQNARIESLANLMTDIDRWRDGRAAVDTNVAAQINQIMGRLQNYNPSQQQVAPPVPPLPRQAPPPVR